MPKFLKQIVSSLSLGLLSLAIITQTPIAHADSDLAKEMSKNDAFGQCVVANASQLSNTSGASGTTCGTAPQGGRGKEVFTQLYNAIWSQGAVITLLDEPLSSKNIINVLKVCSYRITNAGKPTFNKCTEYFTEKCPSFAADSNYSNIPLTTITQEETKTKAFYNCQSKQVLIASSGAGLAQKYLKMIYDFGTTLAGIIAVLIIMINGIKIIVSGSDEAAVSDAKKQITTSLIALAVLFMSGFILYIINPNFFTA